MENETPDLKSRLKEMRRNWNALKPTKTAVFWIIIATTLLTMYIGFSRAGWVTDTTAQKRADASAESAVIARLAPICVAQFNQDPQKDEKLTEFAELTTTSRRTSFVMGQGWATMPDGIEPDSMVARECARQIQLIDE